MEDALLVCFNRAAAAVGILLRTKSIRYELSRGVCRLLNVDGVGVLWKRKELLPLRTDRNNEETYSSASHHHRSAISYFGDDSGRRTYNEFRAELQFFQMNDGRSYFFFF
jgi:hypothetical protein